MTSRTNPFDPAPGALRTRAAILAAWLAAAAFLIAHHAVWRDEVRALTMALAGGDIVAMLRGVQGEGHPALWYLMLRLAHDIMPVPQVLPGVAALIGVAAAGLFAWRAPFRPWVIALALFGGFMLFEYTVSARNYGIAVLLMFLVAAVRPGRGVVVGLLLLALANTSVPAVLFAGALLLFQAIEVASDHQWRWTPALRALIVAGALAAIGVLLCLVTVYPPVNDAAIPPHPGGITIGTVVAALAGVARSMSTLMPTALHDMPGVGGVLAMLLLVSPVSLVRSPAGLAAASMGLIGSILFFGLVYPGSYRHHALYPALLLTLHWMVANGRGGRWPDRLADLRTTRIAAPVAWALIALLALQLPMSIEVLVRAAQGRAYSRSADFAALLRTPPFRRAIVIASPDYLGEPLAYYVDNPMWLMRERRFGRTVRYRRDVILEIGPIELLADARRLRARTGRPVVIALQRPLDPAAPAQSEADGYVTHFTTTPDQVRTFLTATHHIATFDDAPAETYAVYVLR